MIKNRVRVKEMLSVIRIYIAMMDDNDWKDYVTK